MSVVNAVFFNKMTEREKLYGARCHLIMGVDQYECLCKSTRKRLTILINHF